MSEAKTREFDLDAIRTDGWFERIGEGIGSFQALCEIVGERFFAFSIIVGARITALTVDRRNPDLSLVDFVVGVGDNFGGPPAALPGCLNKEGTGYGVSVGKVDGASKAAGTLNSKGLPGYGLLACSALAPVLASGGQDGIGVVEEEGEGIDGAGSQITVDYRPFDATATGGTFGAPVQLADVTHVSLGGVIDLDLSEDSGTGVYATWVDEQGLVLDYSANGGAGWEGSTVVPAPANGGQGNPVIVGTGGGNAEIAYESNPGTGTQVFLQPLNYAAVVAANTPAPVLTGIATVPSDADTVTTRQTSGAASGESLTISAGTVGESDSATVTGPNASTASGTMTYGLYSAPSCVPASRVFSGATAAVGGGVAGSSGAVTSALAPGTYYWQAVYSGDAHNVPNASACGAEVLTVTPAASIGGGASSTGTSVTVTVSCAVTPCTVTITITATETAVVASAARKKVHRRRKTITLATGSFTIRTKGSEKLTVHLTGAGRRFLAAHHGRLSAKIVVANKTAGGTVLTTRTIKITPAKPKRK